MKQQAKKAPEFLKKSVICQIFPRAFTTEGTLAGAAKMLPHLAETGIDIVYLTPIVLADDDTDKEFWSPRQKESGLENPQNPYRMKDYFKLDPEYGTEEDLARFVKTAHELGLRVLLDLVYLHCGPKAFLIDEHPDFVQRNPDGSVKNGPWLFPVLDFKNPNLREYLWENMEYFIREFNVDGYRCDVSGAIPVDFWEEGRRRIEALKPDVVMLAESESPAEQIAAFDMNYKFSQCYMTQDVFMKGESPRKLKEIWEKLHDSFPEGARFINCFENHDIVSDNYEKRMERVMGPKCVEAALAFLFTIDGVPFLYNGQEIADDTRHSIWGNRFHGKIYHINWENALTPVGRERLDFVRTLISMHREIPAFTDGAVHWIDSDKVIAFTRKLEKETVLVVINPSKNAVSVELPLEQSRTTPPEGLLKRNSTIEIQGKTAKTDLLGYGFFIGLI